VTLTLTQSLQPEDVRNIATASQPEDGRSMALRNVGILPQHYTTSQLEDLNLNLHHRENL